MAGSSRKIKHSSSKKRIRNNVRRFRERLLMSKAELAKAAGLSALTIQRVEGGEKCRMSTKRKILKALGLSLGENAKVFGAS